MTKEEGEAARDAASRYAGEIKGRLDVVLDRMDQQDEARETARKALQEQIAGLVQRVEGPETGHVARCMRRLEEHDTVLKLHRACLLTIAAGFCALLLGWDRALVVLKALLKLV